MLKTKHVAVTSWSNGCNSKDWRTDVILLVLNTGYKIPL